MDLAITATAMTVAKGIAKDIPYLNALCGVQAVATAANSEKNNFSKFFNIDKILKLKFVFLIGRCIIKTLNNLRIVLLVGEVDKHCCSEFAVYPLTLAVSATIKITVQLQFIH